MKTEDIKGLADSDLVEKVKEARAELFNLRFQHATGQLDNPGRIKAVKRDIALLLTELRARELSASRDAAAS
jgi:large subunit ribosomal protein L29